MRFNWIIGSVIFALAGLGVAQETRSSANVGSLSQVMGSEQGPANPSQEQVLAEFCIPSASACVAADGRAFEFWWGHRFQLNGHTWYTGFVTTHSSNASGRETALEKERSVYQLTFLRQGQTWQRAPMQAEIGTVFANGPAHTRSTIVSTSPVSQQVIPKDVLMLGVRSEHLKPDGTLLFNYEIFKFLAKSQEWIYVGALPAGSDTSALCAKVDSAPARQADLPCERTEGTLEFVKVFPLTWGVWPNIRISIDRVGTRNGQPFTEKGIESRNYVFNSLTLQYLEQGRSSN